VLEEFGIVRVESFRAVANNSSLHDGCRPTGWPIRGLEMATAGWYTSECAFLDAATSLLDKSALHHRLLAISGGQLLPIRVAKTLRK